MLTSEGYCPAHKPKDQAEPKPWHRLYKRPEWPRLRAEQLARVQADMSKPSGAMVTVAAMPKTVVMDMARRMLIMLLVDMNRLPLIRVKAMTLTTRVSTAAQSIRNLPTDFLCPGMAARLGFGAF